MNFSRLPRARKPLLLSDHDTVLFHVEHQSKPLLPKVDAVFAPEAAASLRSTKKEALLKQVEAEPAAKQTFQHTVGDADLGRSKMIPVKLALGHC